MPEPAFDRHAYHQFSAARTVALDPGGVTVTNDCHCRGPSRIGYAFMSRAALIALLVFISENSAPYQRVETDSAYE